jgi:hypothetical protein
VASLSQEAERVQQHNAQLLVDAKCVAINKTTVSKMQTEILAFQQVNDRLESELLKRGRHATRLIDQVSACEERMALFQQQLILAHHQHQQERHLDDAPLPGAKNAAATSLLERSGGRHKLPLLWDIGSPDALRGSGERRPIAPPPPQDSSLEPQLGATFRPSTGLLRTGSPSRGSNGVTQRALTLHDELASDRIVVERHSASEPRIARPFASDTCRAFQVCDNRTEVTAAAAWHAAGEVHESLVLRELSRRGDANTQELRAVKAGIATQNMHARISKLGATRHYAMLGMMRALTKWALLLELDRSHHAALTHAAHLVHKCADGFANYLGAAQDMTVRSLLFEPQMLGELSGIRRKLQSMHREAEALRGRLCKIMERHGEVVDTDAITTAACLPHSESKSAAEHGRCTKGMRRQQDDRLHQTERAARMGGGQAHCNAMRLQLRMVRQAWRMARQSLARQDSLLKWLSAQLATELEGGAVKAGVLRGEEPMHDLSIDVGPRRQSGPQADLVAATIATSANKQAEREEEVALLSEKLGQLVLERAGLQAVVLSQSVDLELLAFELTRCMQ